MKTIEFSEEQLADLDSIGKALFEDALDPRSGAYVRKLVRPKISWWKIILFVLCPIAYSVLLLICLINYNVPGVICVAMILFFMIIYIAVGFKAICINLVKIYQRYAPEAIRRKCRFEPSCSEYMILAIEKYGVLKGLFKGIDRLKRCNINGGGIDYP